MAVPIPFLPHRFRTAASHYLAGCPPYLPRLIAHVAALTGLDRAGRVLDPGCGPGQLAREFAPLAAEVVAVDPEPPMLRAARQAAGVLSIRFLQGSSYDLGAGLGRFHLAVTGRSLHWMDRAAALQAAIVAALIPFALDGVVAEVVQSYAVIATKPEIA